MAQRLTTQERERIRRALEGRLAIPKLERSELHQYVQQVNYDDGVTSLRKVAMHPDCDRSTALALYWLLQPALGMRELHAPEVIELIELIEARDAAGAYATTMYRFDPARWMESADDATGLPERLVVAVDGIDGDPADLSPSILRRPTDDELAAQQALVDDARALMAALGVDIEHGDAQRTVGAMARAVGTALAERPRRRDLVDLRHLWVDCLRRVGGWEWAAWVDLDTDESSVVLLSPDRTLATNGQTVFGHVVSGFREPRSISDVFHRMRSANYKEKCREDVGYGLVTGVGDVPFVDR